MTISLIQYFLNMLVPSIIVHQIQLFSLYDPHELVRQIQI